MTRTIDTRICIAKFTLHPVAFERQQVGIEAPDCLVTIYLLRAFEKFKSMEKMTTSSCSGWGRLAIEILPISDTTAALNAQSVKFLSSN